jgi:N-acetylglucosamine-6-phosphate deacetylase
LNHSWGIPLTLRSETLVTPYQVLSPGWLVMRDGKIADVGSGDAPDDVRIVNLGEHLIVPGFIDLHVHGGAGAQVNGDDAAGVADEVRRLAEHHARHGTTALLATTVSDSVEDLQETLRGIGRCLSGQDSAGARVLGAHLEGPWIAPARAGAHDVRHLRPPSRSELAQLLGVSPGVVKLITLAPELDGAVDVIAAIVEAGVVASIGHTDADLATTRVAIDAGARHVTHLFNAMPGLRHRRPGPVGVALTDQRVTVEVVADGVHLDPVVLALVMLAAGDRVVAVTDASAAVGLAAGRVRLGSREVDVRGDRVVLADAPDTLAGSLLTMDRAVANLVSAGASLAAAVSTATSTPARVIGELDRGVIRVGAVADIVVLDPDLRCAATVMGGHVVFDPTGLIP